MQIHILKFNYNLISFKNSTILSCKNQIKIGQLNIKDNENTEEQKNNLKNYTYNEYLQTVYGALGTLTDDEKDSVLSSLKVNEIFEFLTVEEKANQYINELQNTLFAGLKFHNSLCKLLGIEIPKNKTLVETYRDLDKDSKFKLTLELMNEPDFQKDCSQILINDYKRLAKSDSVIGAIDKILNIGGYFERALAQGIGCDHKYEDVK